MRQDDDHLYYTERARQERERAGRCDDNAAALAHARLADEYDRRARDSAPMPIASIATR
jgi:hypothetical protein